MKMTSLKIFLVFTFLNLLHPKISYCQGCCAGGGGSPIAGGASQGVLQKDQLNIGINFQRTFSDKFLGVDPAIPQLLESYNTNYLYTGLSYGVTKDFTM